MKRYLMYIVIGMVLIGMVAGCTSATNDIEVQLGQDISLSPGQTAVIKGEDFKIKFVEVISDSRCPEGVVCVWAGEVSSLVEIIYSGSTYPLVLSQPGLTGDPGKKTFQDYEISFYVLPYPRAGKEISENEYRLHLIVNKSETLAGGILVTFDVVGESYSIFITNEATIAEVLAVQREESQATIPSGLIVKGTVPYNEPWSWHIDPEDIHMAEMTIELCDGTPSLVESDLAYWVATVKRFCPWSARIVDIQDYR